MKRSIKQIGILVLLLLVAAFGFAACDDNDSNSDGGTQKPQSGIGDNGNNEPISCQHNVICEGIPVPMFLDN